MTQQGYLPEDQRQNKVHPHKFAMWIAMASIVMMFAGLTSAFLVRQAQLNWRTYEIPNTFWVSTFVIVISSLTIHLALKAFKARQMQRYRTLITTTLLLGIAFCVLQWVGFKQLYNMPQVENYGGVLGEAKPVTLSGNPSESFLFIIAGLHLLHIIGGIVALAIVYLRAFRKRIKEYSSTAIEIVATYWHFVDVLWIYLFLFFLVNL